MEEAGLLLETKYLNLGLLQQMLEEEMKDKASLLQDIEEVIEEDLKEASFQQELEEAIEEELKANNVEERKPSQNKE